MADLTLDQVREKFPQYKDLSDDQLAQGLHKKYYPDMPFEDFSAKIGYKSKAEPETTYQKVEKGLRTAREAIDPYEFLKSVGERGSAIGQGLVADVAGLPGAAEKFLAVDVPSYLGQKKQSVPITGRETFFPTTEEISKTELFQTPEAKKYPLEAALGRNLYEIIGGAGLLKGLVSSSKIIPTVENALGRGVTKAEEDALSKANEVASGRLKELTSEETGILNKMQQEADRVQAAKKATEKAQTAEKSSIGGLKGTKTEESFGAFETVPETKQETGNYLRNIYENFVDSVRKVRSAKADEEINAARNAAAAKEASGLSFTSSKPMQELKDLIDERLSQTTDRSIADELNRIKNALFAGRVEGGKVVANPNFSSSEDIRRLLGDAAFGVPNKEGYAAIGQNIARDLYGKLSNAMKSYEPSFGSYLDRYKKLSDTLETTGTKLGKALGATEKDASSYYATDASALPDRAFKSGESVKTLIDALGGNKEPVMAAAERWFAQKAYELGDLEKVRKFLKSNQMREIVSELGPEFEKRITNKYLTEATAQSSRVQNLKNTISVSEKSIEDANKRLKDLGASKQTLEEGVKNIENALNEKDRQTAISNLVTRLQSEIPDEKKTQELNSLIQGIKDSVEKRKQARWLSAKVLAPLGLGGAYEAYEKLRGQ
jgi:hypothetical protein